MGFVRSVLFPGLRLVIWAIIALALSVLAFGGGGGGAVSSAGPVEPSAELGRQTISAERGDISSSIELSGTVAADPAVTVRSTAAGVVTKVHRRVGERVEAGTPLVDVRTTIEPTAADGAPPAPPRTRTTTVTAGSAGTVASMAVLAQQEVSVGTDLATVSPGTLSVSAPMTQSQQFRLLAPPATASAQARGGPAPFVCGALSTAVAAAGAAGGSGPQGVDPYTGQQIEASTAQVTCRVPPATTVFAGMSVDLTIDTGSATQVLVVPVSAVQGTVANGTVWVVGDDGEPVARPVRLGLTDGRTVEVTEGLRVGEQLLEFTLVEPDDEPSSFDGYEGPR